MFTGIIETVGTVKSTEQENENIHFTIESNLSDQLRIDQSVAHDGVCLTVTGLEPGIHHVTAVKETIAKTNLNNWLPGKKINLERAMRLGDRLDGHIVQGHVDCKAICVQQTEAGGSYIFRFSFPEPFAALLIEKGSVCINGVSLTVFDLGRDLFSVTIIPYTFHHTAFLYVAPGQEVNIEFDILGKYILRRENLGKSSS
jgi:riboflavin synthase